jgi:integrase
VEQARTFASRIIEKFKKDELDKAPRENTLGEFIKTEYRPHISRRLKTAEATFQRIEKLFKEFSSIPANKITPEMLDKWVDSRLEKGIKPHTVIRDIAILKSALNYAVKQGRLVKNPTNKMIKIKAPDNKPIRHLSRDEMKRMLCALERSEGAIVPFIKLALNTGMRKSELLGMKWTDINFDLKQVKLTNTKNGENRFVNLNSTAVEVLRRWKKIFDNHNNSCSGYVFPTHRGVRLWDVRKEFLKVLDLAEITDFRIHDMRHTFASNILMAGEGDLYTVQKLLGHSRIQYTERYSHLATVHLAAAVESLVDV